MPIIKSAKKRVRTARKATIRNSKTKRNLKASIKKFQLTLTSKKKDAPKALADAQSAVDIAQKKGILHKNKAARAKRRLASQAKAAGVKPAASTPSKTAKKPATAKKTTPKKSPTTKKATAKKPAAKKITKKS